MKIAFLLRIWPVYGGGETVTVVLANELVKRGVEVEVIYFHDTPQGIALPDIDSRIKAIRIPDIKLNEYSKDLFVNKDDARNADNTLEEIVRRDKIDILHNQWWPIEYYQNTRRNTHVKVVTVLHMQPDLRREFDFKGIKGKVFKMIEPVYRKFEEEKNLYRSDRYYKGSDKYVFLADPFMDYYRKKRHLPNDDAKTGFIYNPSTFRSYSDEEQLKEDTKEMLMVGRLVEDHKKVLRLIRSWQLAEKKGLQGWHLTIVGDGPDKNRYEEFVKGEGITDVFFEGFQAPLEYYKRAAIFGMTSAYEGFCMTLVEAMQNGCVPIVMDTFAACHVIIRNDYNGLLVPDDDIQAFSNAIIELATNQEKRIRLKKNGLISCRDFSVEKIAGQWIELYNKLMSE